MTNEEIREYLRAPATRQQVLDALGVHSISSTREEDALQVQYDNRAASGCDRVPVGAGFITDK